MSAIGHPLRSDVVEDVKELLGDLCVPLFFNSRRGNRASHGFDEVGRFADCEICFGGGRRFSICQVQFSHGRGDAVSITHVELV